jgi:uncharacterized membrane protein YkoI
MLITRRNILGLAMLISASAAMPAQAEAAVHSVLPSPAAPIAQAYIQYAQAAISPSKAKAIAAKRVPNAKFVDISRGGNKYRVRMIKKNGQVVDVLIDAVSGRVLN